MIFQCAFLCQPPAKSGEHKQQQNAQYLNEIKVGGGWGVRFQVANIADNKQSQQ